LLPGGNFAIGGSATWLKEILLADSETGIAKSGRGINENEFTNR
jgi:hypothetical protein